MIKFLRWILGYSKFKIEGNVDLFISKFSNVLWSVKKQNGNFYANCLTKNYKFLDAEAKKYECFLTNCANLGFLNLVKRYILRKGIVVGLIIFALILFFSNFFVWTVEVHGNVLIPDEKIFRVCDKCGLHTGAWIFGVNVEEVEFKLKEAFKNIGWVSVNRFAGKYVVEIKEGELKPDIVAKSNHPCNVTAAYDGLILSIKPFSGFVQAKAGDYVKKNQILVSAVDQNNKLNNVLFAHSDAEVIAKVDRYHEVSLPKLSVRRQRTGDMQIDNKIKLFGLNIPIESKKIGKNAVKINEYVEPLEFLGIRLPILCKKTVYDVVKSTKVMNDKDQIKRMLLNKQKDWENRALLNATILNRRYGFVENQEEIVLKTIVTVCQRIDQKQPVYISNDEVVAEDESDNEEFED